MVSVPRLKELIHDDLCGRPSLSVSMNLIRKLHLNVAVAITTKGAPDARQILHWASMVGYGEYIEFTGIVQTR